MGCTRAVSLYTPLRTTHDLRRLCDVHFLPVTQQKSLTLTDRDFNAFSIKAILAQLIVGGDSIHWASVSTSSVFQRRSPRPIRPKRRDRVVT